MQCCGCGGNHLHIYCPQRGDKARTVHSVQQTVTIDDIGRNMPRIYGALDNK
jgi:hypothetical protein